MINRNYLRVIVRGKGVPEMWVEDVVSDIWLYCWLRNDWRKVVIARRAIEGARDYGPRRRDGTPRETVGFQYLKDSDNDHWERHDMPSRFWDHPQYRDEYAVVDAMLDAEQGLRRLALTDVEIIERRVQEGKQSYGAPWSNVEHIRLCNARKRLRKMIA